MKVHHAESIEEAIDDFQDFIESDLWYSFNVEFESESDMVEYLESHINILRKEIKSIAPKLYSKKGEKTNLEND